MKVFESFARSSEIMLESSSPSFEHVLCFPLNKYTLNVAYSTQYFVSAQVAILTPFFALYCIKLSRGYLTLPSWNALVTDR